MKGFQEADGASHPPEEMTQMLDGVRLFLQDSKEHGMSNVFAKMVDDHVTTAGVDEHGKPKALSSLAEGKMPFAGTNAESMAAAVASMAGLGMAGFDPGATLKAINSGPMSKYLKEMGTGEDGPLLKAGLAYLDNSNATSLSEGDAVEKAMPAALDQLHQMGLDVPVLDPDTVASLKTAMAKMS